MPNMSYCRFQNTSRDLSDCYENMGDTLSGEEFAARARVIELARRIVYEYGEAEFEEETDE